MSSGPTRTEPQPLHHVPIGARLVAVVPLATGAALLVYLLAGVSLLLALAVSVIAAAVAACTVWGRTPPAARAEVVWRARTGLLIGVLATAAYDLTRLVGANLGATSIQPFDIWRLFGETLVGGTSSTVQWTVGTAFHYANGLGFAVAYVVFVPHPRVWTAVVWAALLNVLMLAMYPPWLGLSPATTEELAFVSILGHLAYGAVLGGASKTAVGRHLAAEDAACSP